MNGFRRVAPIFPVRDLDTSLAYYARLGFSIRAYGGGGYGFAVADGVELHLGVVSDVGVLGRGSAYLCVDDSEAVAARWRAAGIAVHEPQDTEWGQHEGAVVDPDGNVIRYGSPMTEAGH
jgi:catechol 2,3-dioxygenase-like lactoylglutathione lyase family enzyme